jgi:hypothetical protein
MSVRFRATPGFDQRFRVDPRDMEKVARIAAKSVRQATPEQRGLARKGVRADGDRVVSTYPFAHIVEWGSVNSPAYAPFRRGIRAAGLRLDESRL